MQAKLFYYPYATLPGQVSPLLRTVALYFDELVLLDPVGATWDAIGVAPQVSNDLALLQNLKILKRLDPAHVIAEHGDAITRDVRADLRDAEFVRLCTDHEQFTGKSRWTLALSKVPAALLEDERLRRFMKEVPRAAPEALRPSARYYEEWGIGEDRMVEEEYAYDEMRNGVAYRYIDVPLALGVSIMMNHALHAGLFGSGATPITDDPFHARVLAHKYQRALDSAAVRDMGPRRQVKADRLAAHALADIDLGMIPDSLSLSELLDHRFKHDAELREARTALGRLAQTIEDETWDVNLLDAKLPELRTKLAPAQSSLRGWLKGAGVGITAVSAILTIVATPFAGVLALGGAGLAASEALLDRQEKNGLRYFLRLQQ